jgi:FkbM family methyltransferase
VSAPGRRDADVISYAQNYEDVVLERCFADVAAGFYIDVGAWDPFEHSVTHYFYERGWSGINIEPNPEYFERLERDRTRDTNLRVALGETDQESQTFTILKGSGISTLRSLSDDYLENLDGRGYPQEPVEVSTVTLASVCRDHVPEGTEIEFLKIDVEGWEAQVLRGHDWDRWRPKVLVIEAITPVAFDEATGRDVYADSSSEWEPIVLEHGYVFGLNDGLNRFYVRQESSELLEHLRVPANCMDDAERYAPWSWRTQLIAAHGEIATLVDALGEERRETESRREEVERLRAELVAARSRVDELVGSTSWRVTRPLRSLGQIRKPPPG